MAKHKVITIKVAYDEAEYIPTNDELKYAVEYAIGDGMLTEARFSGSYLDEFSIEIADTQE